MKIRVKGIKRLSSRLNRMNKAYEKAAEDILLEGALKLQEEMRNSIQKGSKTGRRYKHGTVTHQASAAGEAPASDTGTLAASIHPRKGKKKLQYFSGSNQGQGTKYAKSLEFGTRNIAPRPFVKPAFDKWHDKIKKALKRAIQNAAKRK